jgi:hypothetical protein
MNKLKFGDSKSYRFIKWWIIYVISLLLGGFILGRLMITNPFLNLICLAFILSVIAQAIKNHEHTRNKFRAKWFIFYFLVYANIIWVMKEIVLP